MLQYTEWTDIFYLRNRLKWIFGVIVEIKQIKKENPASSVSMKHCGKVTEWLQDPNVRSVEENTHSQTSSGYTQRSYSQRLQEGFRLLHLAYNDQ